MKTKSKLIGNASEATTLGNLDTFGRNPVGGAAERGANRTKRPSSAAVMEAMEARRLLTSVVVNTTIDALFPAGSPFISLRNALATASANTSTTITFDPKVFASAETITLNGTQLELGGSGTTTITAPSAGLTLDGNNLSRVFLLDPGPTATLTGLHIINGNTGAPGGGIANESTLILNDVTLSDNYSSAYGGGISNLGGNLTLNNSVMSDNTSASTSAIDNNYNGRLVLKNSTINGSKGNAAINMNGGTLTLSDDTLSANTTSSSTLVVQAGATATLVNVTIANNIDTGSGGGIGDYGGTLSLAGVTITGNSAVNGGGLYNVSTPPTISNSVIAGNTVTSGTGPDVDGTVNSLGFNLIGKSDGSTGFNAADLTGTIAHPLSAKLGSLANNGGPTETLLPESGSPAIGAGEVAYVPSGVTTDQRGLPRVVDGKVDIGAVEVQPGVTTTIAVTAPAAQTATVGTAKSFSLGSYTESNATGPYTATIVWGDGSTNTTIALTAAGTIPATSHTYTKAGTDTVSVTVTDSASHTSNKATFVVTVSTAATGTISGTVFNDVNGDKKLDDGELGLGGYTVFIDLKGTGKFATGDPIAVTAFNGTWLFSDLAAGTYKILVEPETGVTATSPTELTFTLAAGATSSGNLFGEKAI